MSAVALPEPSKQVGEVKELFLQYLDYFRAVVARKVGGLSEAQLRRSRLPSGWTPLELVKHLAYMERRWLRWGFAAEDVGDPWGDNGADGRWHVAPDESLDELVGRLHEGGERTRAIVQRASLTDRAAVGGRFTADDVLPTLGWTLFHVLQEYARHAGHLDIVRELTDGEVGE